MAETANTLEQEIRLFYCYAREDKALRDELQIHLSGLKRQYRLTNWYDREILPGEKWEEVIDRHLSLADVILLLISPHFVDSDYCYGKEMQRALERHHAGSCCVIPILLRPTYWEETPFSTIQMLPTDAKPVTRWSDRDEAFHDVARGIATAIKALLTTHSNKNKGVGVIEGSSTGNILSSKQVVVTAPISDISEIKGINQLNLYTALDIGTTRVRALIIEVQEDGVGEVLGFGHYPQSYNHMSDGIVTDIPGVIANCNEALVKAEESAGGIIAPPTVIGIVGELVKGSSITITRQRTDPNKEITPDELESMIANAQKKLYKIAKERIAAEIGKSNVEVRLANTAVISVRINGQPVYNPIGWRGRHFQLTVFSSFASLEQLSALVTVAEGLDLTLISIVAEPYALARCLSVDAGLDSGAIFIDIGGGTTDIALVRQGVIEETRMFALGGRTFTRRLAFSKGLSLKEAENLKILYSTGNLKGAERDEVRTILAPDTQIWMDSIELLADELAKGELLPPAIYMVGGGSALPDLHERLESFPWKDRLPFSRNPLIEIIQPGMVNTISDPKNLLKNAQDITPMALAYHAIEIMDETNVLEHALSRVIHRMHI